MRVIVVEGEASETGEHGTSEVAVYADSAKQVMDWLADSTGAEITSDGRWSLGFPETAECSLLRRLQDVQCARRRRLEDASARSSVRRRA